MAEKNAAENAGGTNATAEFSGAVVKAALQLTWKLNGDLKNSQIAYIRVGVQLARVRDEKLYAALKHPDLESYARQRLHLGRSALYKYLQVHDWICRCHRDWLEPSPKGFIPNLSEAADLIWIETELAKPGLEAKKRAALEELQGRALDGSLADGELEKWRKRGRQPAAESLKSFLSKLRLLRRRSAELKPMPPEVISHLDAAIAILGNARTLQVAGLNLVETGAAALCRGNFLV